MGAPRGVAGRIAGECVSVRLRLINRAISAVYDRALRPHGLRVSQLNILVAVAAMGPVAQAELAARLGLERSTLSRDLDRLLDRGWVEAVAAEGRARRLLQVTKEGAALIERLAPSWSAAQREAKGLLGDDLARALGEVGDRWMRDGPRPHA